jgi:anti-sigma B factor antagonist
MMKTSIRQINGITVVDLSGHITLDQGSLVLRDIVRELLTKGQKKILLHLGEVTAIDSSGIGELVNAYTSVRDQGGELKLLNISEKVQDLLQVTKLQAVFDISGEEATALASFTA